MKPHRTPFENRWTSGEQGWRWFKELEREGVGNIRAMFIEHEIHRPSDPIAVFDVPTGFVRDWLAYRDRCGVRAERRWRIFLGVLLALIACGVIMTTWGVLRAGL
ncbi:MAG: hypothetical protein WA840_24455 [Caulobacteraceae bacterium]